MPTLDPAGTRFVEDAFWIVLGRAATPKELRDELRPPRRTACGAH